MMVVRVMMFYIITLYMYVYMINMKSIIVFLLLLFGWCRRLRMLWMWRRCSDARKYKTRERRERARERKKRADIFSRTDEHKRALKLCERNNYEFKELFGLMPETCALYFPPLFFYYSLFFFSLSLYIIHINIGIYTDHHS